MNNEVWKPATFEQAYDKILNGTKSENDFTKDSEESARHIVDMLGIKDTDTVLDIGCGIGRLSKPLTKYCKKIIGLDITDEMGKFCIERMRLEIDNGKFELRIYNGYYFNTLQDNSMDKAISILVLQHNTVHNQYNLTKEIYRVLKPGGLAYIQISDITSKDGWNRFVKIAEDLKSNDFPQGRMKHFHLHPAMFELFCDKSGFEVVSKYRIGESLEYILKK